MLPSASTGDGDTLARRDEEGFRLQPTHIVYNLPAFLGRTVRLPSSDRRVDWDPRIFVVTACVSVPELTALLLVHRPRLDLPAGLESLDNLVRAKFHATRTRTDRSRMLRARG